MKNDYSKIKIIRNSGRIERIFIDDKELKGVTSVEIYNSSTSNEDITSIKIEIGFIILFIIILIYLLYKFYFT